MSALATTQRVFLAAITRPLGAPPAAPGVALCRADDALPAAARLDVYGHMYHARLADVLRADYRHLAQLLGEADFARLAAAYIGRHPSADPNIMFFGRHLAAFVRAAPAAAPRRPDAADLAALEWARTLAVVASDMPPVGADALAALPPEAVPTARLRLVDSLQLLACTHDPCGLWRALEAAADADAVGEAPAAAAPLPPPAAAAHVAVFRRDFAVLHTRLRDVEAAALEVARGGGTVAAICDAFAHEPDPVQAAFAALGSWFADGWVATVLP